MRNTNYFVSTFSEVSVAMRNSPICKYLLMTIIAGIFSGIVAKTQNFYWRDYQHGEIPEDAIEAAPEIYIGQVYHNGALVVTILPHSKIAIGEYFGKKYFRDNIKILCSLYPNRFYWDLINLNEASDQQMKNVVKGGYMESIEDDLYIGKIVHEGEWKVGKVFAWNYRKPGLWIWNQNGDPVNSKEFHLLKYSH